MGVERAVTRWHIQHQTIADEIAALEAKLAQLPQTQAEGQETRNRSVQEAEIMQQLVDARSRLHRLGPCPKPMMG
jgi:uncharacterized protein involved in exopolysaccharide biosynthesis